MGPGFTKPYTEVAWNSLQELRVTIEVMSDDKLRKVLKRLVSDYILFDGTCQRRTSLGFRHAEVILTSLFPDRIE